MSPGTGLADDDPRIAALAMERARTLGAPLLVLGMAASFVLSVPSGIPLTAPVVAGNVLCITLGSLGWIRLARRRVALRHAHAAMGLIWLLAPANTLATLYFTRKSELIFPLLLELSLACALQISRRWLIGTMAIAIAAWLPLVPGTAQAQATIQIGTVAGLFICAVLVASRVRQSLDTALINQSEQERSAMELKHELEERRRAEEERELLRDQFVRAQRMEATGTLAAGLAHDMNNILAAILLQAQLLQQQIARDDWRSELDDLIREAERGAKLTRSLLVYARQGQYERKTVRLDVVLRDIEPVLTRLLSKKATIAWRGGATSAIEGDSAELRQVLLNLCMNAADAMENPGLITIACADVDLGADQAKSLGLAAGAYATFSVTDTGSGMTEATIAHIFEPFFTTKEVGKGTGLGLAMVHGTVHGHGGAISVQSEVGHGSTFTVYLPVSTKTADAPSRGAPALAARSGTEVALVVDDEPMVRAAIAAVLGRMGFSVLAAGDGADALEVFAAHQEQVAVVVLDMSMPVMGGAECFEKLRANKEVPVLLVSGFTSGAETQRLLAGRAVGFLEKPFRADTLSQKIQELLAHPTRA